MNPHFNESGDRVRLTKGEFLERLGLDVEQLVEEGIIDEDELDDIVDRELAAWCCSTSTSCNCSSSSSSTCGFASERPERESEGRA